MTQPFLLEFSPGIQRDGTQFDANAFLDSLWCRWRLGKPRKMGGFQQITDVLAGVPRRIHMFYTGTTTIVHVGTTQGIQQIVIDSNGNFVSEADRTPVGFLPGLNVGWTIDAIFDTTSGAVQLIAHSVPDTTSASSPTQTVPFIGIITDTMPLVQFSDPTASSGVWTQPDIAGGIVCVQPFVFDFDINGLVQWSAPNLALYLGVVGGSSGAGQARISAQKIVAGAPIRGGGVQSPAALFFSLSEVITATFVGTPVWFAFNTVSSSSSILGTDCVVEYDGLYFWAGVDRFLVFNGAVSEVPNPRNQDWFFDNLTPGYEARTYAMKIPRYGEIWWLAAMFGNTEASHAIIYNVRENCWYDTELPNGGRSTGYLAQGLRYPVMGGTTKGPNGYSLWLHERGVDQVVNGAFSPVRSFFETGIFGGPKNPQMDDRQLNFHQLEPDFVQSNDLEFWLRGQANARAPLADSAHVTLQDFSNTAQQQFASFTATQPLRLTRLHVESNVVGGNYVAGRNIGHAEPGPARKIG